MSVSQRQRRDQGPASEQRHALAVDWVARQLQWERVLDRLHEADGE